MKNLLNKGYLAILCLALFASCTKDDATIPQQGSVKRYELGAVSSTPQQLAAVPFASNIEMRGRGGSLPASYTMTMPPIGDQGSLPSCVAFAVAYGARSADKFYNNGGPYSYTTNIFSPEYVYNQIKLGDCNGGARMIDALNLLKSSGVCTWSSMPYNATDGCNTLPNTSQSSNAGQNKIKGFSQLSPTDLSGIRNSVANDKPVMAIIQVYNNFFTAGAGYIYNSTAGGYAGNHAIVICGYDNTRNAFRIANSWGTGWGEGGYSWINYNFFGQISSEAYVFR